MVDPVDIAAAEVVVVTPVVAVDPLVDTPAVVDPVVVDIPAVVDMPVEDRVVDIRLVEEVAVDSPVVDRLDSVDLDSEVECRAVDSEVGMVKYTFPELYNLFFFFK